MNVPKQQLRAYYRRQGVGIRRTEKLVKSDMVQVKALAGQWFDRSEELDWQFLWEASLQGHDYWEDRHFGDKC